MRRNYRKEYDNYQGTDKQKKNRAKRNAARRLMEKAGKVKRDLTIVVSSVFVDPCFQ